MLDVDDEPLQALAAELGEDDWPVRADVTDLASWRPRSPWASRRFGGIDTVVANAGIASYGSVLHVDPAVFRRVVDINVTGVFHTVRAALPHVIEQRGYVLVVSSLAAFTAAPGMASYNASKAGAEHFANALRLEVAHLGVAVGSAHMCWIDTPMVQDARKDLSAFDTMIRKLPPPLNRTTSVEACVDAFVDRHQRRSRRIYVPGWVGAIAKARRRRELAGRRAADPAQRGRTSVEAMDEEVGRWAARPPRATPTPSDPAQGSVRAQPANRARSARRSHGHTVGGTASTRRSPTSRASDWPGSTAKARSTPHHASAPSPADPGGEGHQRRRSGRGVGRRELHGALPDPHPGVGGARLEGAERHVTDLADLTPAARGRGCPAARPSATVPGPGSATSPRPPARGGGGSRASRRA